MGDRRERGRLEAEVLRRLWDASHPMTSRELREAFDDQGRPALTTLLTVLSRLEKKQLVARADAPAGATFTATHPEAEQVAAGMRTMLQDVSDREAVLLQFAGSLDAEDTAALRRALGRHGS